MDIGDWITTISILVGVIIAIVIMLKISNQIEDSLKPDIQVYIDYIESNIDCIFVIKNFGKRGTTIKNFKVDPNTNALAIKIMKDIFNENISRYIAPGQAIKIPLAQIQELKKETTKIDFSFTYKYNNVEYDKSFSLDLSYTNI